MQSLHKIETVCTREEWERWHNKNKRKIAIYKMKKRLKQAYKLSFLLACFFVITSPISILIYFFTNGNYKSSNNSWLIIGLVISLVVVIIECYMEDWLNDTGGKHYKNKRTGHHRRTSQ